MKTEDRGLTDPSLPTSLHFLLEVILLALSIECVMLYFISVLKICKIFLHPPLLLQIFPLHLLTEIVF